GGGLAVGLLGPVELGPAGETMTGVAQPRLRVLLGLLGVAAGRVVSAAALVGGVWEEEWSPRREQNLHALVYQLRRRLAALEPGGGPGRGGARLARGGSGYRLVLGAGAAGGAAEWGGGEARSGLWVAVARWGSGEGVAGRWPVGARERAWARAPRVGSSMRTGRAGPASTRGLRQEAAGWCGLPSGVVL